MKNKIANEQPSQIINDGKAAEFLLKEYDRLVEYQKLTLDDYNRWFNIYLGVASAAIVVLVPLSQAIPTGNEPLISNIILLGLLFIGYANFVGLSYANSTSIQHERAIRLIQDYFIKQEPNLTKYLYFRVNKVGVTGTGIRALITRGLSSGSPKSLLVLINSIVASILLVKIGVETGYWSNAYQSLYIGSAIFIASSILHLLIARTVYKVHGI
jgi:hypothetical protein